MITETSKNKAVIVKAVPMLISQAKEKVYTVGGQGWTIVIKDSPDSMTVSRMGPGPSSGVTYILDKNRGNIISGGMGGRSSCKPNDPSYIGILGNMIKNVNKAYENSKVSGYLVPEHKNPDLEKFVSYLNAKAAKVIPLVKISVPTEISNEGYLGSKGQVKRSVDVKVEVKDGQKILTVVQSFASNSGIITRTLNLNTGMAREYSVGSATSGKFKEEIIDSMLADVNIALSKAPADKNLQLIRYYLESVKENK